jgi:hypothetical protein
MCHRPATGRGSFPKPGGRVQANSTLPQPSLLSKDYSLSSRWRGAKGEGGLRRDFNFTLGQPHNADGRRRFPHSAARGR